MCATILIVDDNAVQAATRQAILQRAGYEVLAVLSPQLALEQLRNYGLDSAVDLIVTDHMMPGMSGAELIACVREFSPEIPVLVISGLAEAEDEYSRLGVTFRLKPLPPDKLLDCIHLLLQASLSCRSPA